MTTLHLTLRDGGISLDEGLCACVLVEEVDGGCTYASGRGELVCVRIDGGVADATRVPAGMLVEIADYDTGVREGFSELGRVFSDWQLGELAA